MGFQCDRVCCFLSLKTGTKIAGLFHIICGIISLSFQLFIAVRAVGILLYPMRINVIYAYDLVPSLQIIFGIYMYYGAIKEDTKYIYAGAMFSYNVIIIFAFEMISITAVHKSWSIRYILVEYLIHMVAYCYFLSVLAFYIKELKQKKSIIDQTRDILRQVEQ